MRSSYNKSDGSGPPTELNTRPPGYRDLEDRISTLEKLVTYQDDAIKELQSKLGGSDGSSEESPSQA